MKYLQYSSICFFLEFSSLSPFSFSSSSIPKLSRINKSVFTVGSVKLFIFFSLKTSLHFSNNKFLASSWYLSVSLMIKDIISFIWFSILSLHCLFNPLNISLVVPVFLVSIKIRLNISTKSLRSTNWGKSCKKYCIFLSLDFCKLLKSLKSISLNKIKWRQRSKSGPKISDILDISGWIDLKSFLFFSMLINK